MFVLDRVYSHNIYYDGRLFARITIITITSNSRRTRVSTNFMTLWLFCDDICKSSITIIRLRFVWVTDWRESITGLVAVLFCNYDWCGFILSQLIHHNFTDSITLVWSGFILSNFSVKQVWHKPANIYYTYGGSVILNIYQTKLHYHHNTASGVVHSIIPKRIVHYIVQTDLVLLGI